MKDKTYDALTWSLGERLTVADENTIRRILSMSAAMKRGALSGAVFTDDDHRFISDRIDAYERDLAFQGVKERIATNGLSDKERSAVMDRITAIRMSGGTRSNSPMLSDLEDIVVMDDGICNNIHPEPADIADATIPLIDECVTLSENPVIADIRDHAARDHAARDTVDEYDPLQCFCRESPIYGSTFCAFIRLAEAMRLVGRSVETFGRQLAKSFRDDGKER